MLEHLDIDLATLVIGHESLEDELIGVVAISGHLLLEHVDHAHDVAGSSDLSHQLIELTLRHEDTNVVKSSTEIIFVQGTALLMSINLKQSLYIWTCSSEKPPSFCPLPMMRCGCCSVYNKQATPMYSALI